MRNKIRSLDWQSITLCVLISGMFLSFVLDTFFVQTLLLWLLGGFAIYTGIRNRKFYFQWYSVFFAALFLLRIVAFWRQPELKFSNVELASSFVLFPLIFSLVNVNEKQWKIIQIIVVSGFAVFLCIVFYHFIVEIYFKNLVRETLANAKGYYSIFFKKPFLNHPSFLAIILAPSIPMCFNLAAKSVKIWQQWLWLLFIPALLFIVFVSGSRTGLIISVGLTALCSLYFFKKLNSVTTLVLGVVLGAMLVFSQNSTVNYTEDPVRKEMNHFAIEKINKQPLWGYGYGTQHALLNDTINSTTFQNPFILELNHFHNTYLDELFQFGIIGTLPFFLLVLYLIGFALKKRDIFLLSWLVIYLSFFYTELPFNSVKGLMPMMLFLAVIMSVRNKQIQSEKKIPLQ